LSLPSPVRKWCNDATLKLCGATWRVLGFFFYGGWVVGLFNHEPLDSVVAVVV